MLLVQVWLLPGRKYDTPRSEYLFGGADRVVPD